MKRGLLTFLVLAIGAISYAQPRSLGLRLAPSGLEAVYQQTMEKNQFIEGNLGLDFGYKNIPGIKATATYNFIWARPAWSDKGSWAIYAGPGATLGYVNDEVHYKAADGLNIITYPDSGFIIGICGHVGLEYSFEFPLQIAIDLRPCIGLHINDGYTYTDPSTLKTEKYGTRIGFYDNGLLGLSPNVSIRYRF